jgi:hypothetical protein
MSIRWDEAESAFQRNRWLMDTMVLLSLDIARRVAKDLALEDKSILTAQAELRRVLAPPFQERLADPSVSFHADILFGLCELPVQKLVREFYDRVIRYAEAEPSALFDWGIVLMRCAKTDSLWSSLALPPGSSNFLRESLVASLQWTDIQERLDAAFANRLSSWDTQVAVLRLFPPQEENTFGISEIPFSKAAKIVRKQGFWRAAAEHLGADGLRKLHIRAQEFLATQADLAEAFGQLYDPWLLAHPEVTTLRTPVSPKA